MRNCLRPPGPPTQGNTPLSHARSNQAASRILRASLGSMMQASITSRDYSASQVFADAARSFGFEIIKYKSVRDPKGLANLALLHCTVFTKPEPLERMSWKLHLDAQGARALCEVAPAVDRIRSHRLCARSAAGEFQVG